MWFRDITQYGVIFAVLAEVTAGQEDLTCPDGLQVVQTQPIQLVNGTNTFYSTITKYVECRDRTEYR
jgi:hypothetical protein